MVTSDLQVLKEALSHVAEFRRLSGSLKCPHCADGAMTEDELWHHIPLYHNQQQNQNIQCPVCGSRENVFGVHYRNSHGPCSRNEIPNEHSLTVKRTYTFTLMVCRRKDGKFLMVHEVADWGWWLPGGRINSGEDLIQSVTRETKEETGIDVRVTGVLRLEYSPSHLTDARMRVIFYGEPADEKQKPKSLPDFESLSAAWVDVSQLGGIPLRGREPLEWFNYIHNGGTVYPLAVISRER